MEPRRMVLLSMGAAIGCSLAGCVVGGVVGVLFPDVIRTYFLISSGSPFHPERVGLGVGVIAGFAAGTAVVAVGLVAALVPGLRSWRPFARGVLRPSLAGLALFIAVVGLGLASLRMPSRAGAEVWFGMTALALALATLVAFERPPGRRGFAAGFAVFGWSYMVMSLLPESRAELPTSRPLAILEKQISGEWRMGVQFLEIDMQAFPARQRGLYWEPVATSRGGIPARLEIDEVQPEFRRIGHSLLTLLLAALGGAVGDTCLSRRGPLRPPSASGDL